MFLFDIAGEHTIGRSHCTSFDNRLYNFSTTASQDPTLDPKHAAMLKQECPKVNNQPNLVVPMDPSTSSTFDVNYYIDIINNKGLFTSDQTLLSQSATSGSVKQNAGNPYLWENKFVAAIVKMGKIGILTGTAGEIRSDFRKINP